MFGIVPFRKNNNLLKGDDYFTPFLKNFFDDDFFTSLNTIQGSFKVDLKENDKNYLVEADLPGVKKESIDIDFNNNYLTISANREDSVEEKKDSYVRRERYYGEFRRSFYIDNVDENRIEASFNDGVLKVSLPKITKVYDQKRKIEIQ